MEACFFNIFIGGWGVGEDDPNLMDDLRSGADSGNERIIRDLVAIFDYHYEQIAFGRLKS